MTEYKGMMLPDGETHLIDWMRIDGRLREGRATYQLHKYEAALRRVPAGRRRHAVDVGAHVGLWTRVMALDFARVTAFEPMPTHLECLRANLASTPNVTVRPHALGEAPGMVRIATRTPGSSGDTGVALLAQAGGVEVPLFRLDDLGLEDVDLLKVDNEGYEYFVVKGGQEMIRRCRPVVIVEQKPGMGQRYGLRERQAVEALEALGMRLLDSMSGDFILGWA
jgi:FkbM family methyltransferase